MSRYSSFHSNANARSISTSITIPFHWIEDRKLWWTRARSQFRGCVLHSICSNSCPNSRYSLYRIYCVIWNNVAVIYPFTYVRLPGKATRKCSEGWIVQLTNSWCRTWRLHLWAWIETQLIRAIPPKILPPPRSDPVTPPDEAGFMPHPLWEDLQLPWMRSDLRSAPQAPASLTITVLTCWSL